jgi:hypothetical protein
MKTSYPFQLLLEATIDHFHWGILLPFNCHRLDNRL